MENKLTPKQWRFVEEYLIDLNGTQAAIRAGYSPNCAAQQAYENLRKPEIVALIDDLQNARAERANVRQDDVVQELRRMAFANIIDYLDFTDEGVAQPRVDLTWLTRDKAAALIEITETVGADDTRTVKVKMHDKLSALVKLGQHLGMWSSRRELVPKRLDEMDSDEIRTLLGHDLPVDQADDNHSDGLN